MGQPLVLLIYCDELRADALSCNGGPKGLTPHIDKLAQEGLNFKKAFCASPVCVPCRWSGLTGKSVNQTGVWHNEGAWRGYEMGVDSPTVLDVFRDAGWRTVNVGKIHLPEGRNPFDENYPEGGAQGELTQRMKTLGRHLDHAPKGAENLGGIWPEEEFFPAEGIAETVLERVASLDDGPLFIRASYLQPHTPVLPYQADFDRWYQEDWPEIGLDSPVPSEFEKLQADNYGSADMDASQARRCWWAYHALVHWVDRQVGALLQGIDDLGRTEDLKIVFTADHGASLGEGGAWAKQSFKVGSHRIPLIIWGGGSASQDREDISDSTDLPRTLCELAGLEPLNDFGGRSLLSDSEPPAVISGIGYGLSWSRLMPNRKYGPWSNGRGWPRRVCVRTSEWRYDRNVRFEGEDVALESEEADPCLIHTNSDPKEEKNLFENPEYLAVAQDLEAKLQDWLEDGVEPSSMPPPPKPSR